MGILDTIKGLFKGREHQIKGGIDKVSDTLERKVPGQAGRIDDLSDKAKGAVDKLGAEPGAARAPATATSPTPAPTPPTTTASTPPSTTSTAPATSTPPAGTGPDPTPPPP